VISTRGGDGGGGGAIAACARARAGAVTAAAAAAALTAVAVVALAAAEYGLALAGAERTGGSSTAEARRASCALRVSGAMLLSAAVGNGSGDEAHEAIMGLCAM
jgi:hypothetical protein